MNKTDEIRLNIKAYIKDKDVFILADLIEYLGFNYTDNNSVIVRKICSDLVNNNTIMFLNKIKRSNKYLVL